MLTINIEKTGVNIRRLQKENNMTGKVLADICGVTPAAVSRWGKNCMPTIDALIIMAHIWNTTIDDILAIDNT